MTNVNHTSTNGAISVTNSNNGIPAPNNKSAGLPVEARVTYSFTKRVAGGFLAAGVFAFTCMVAGPLPAQVVQRPSAVRAMTEAVYFAGTQPGKSPNSAAPNANSNQFGELSALWWEWIYSFPAAINPNLTNGVVDCGYGQSSHSRSTQIWFLAGTFGGPADRTCTVPRGIALFFPLLNIEYDNVGCCVPTAPPFTYNIQEMKQLAALTQDNPLELHASVDGAPVPAYRAQSQVFSYSFPATGNVLQFLGLTAPGANWPSTTVFPAVSDGFWVMVDPLPPGQHLIKFGGISNNGFTVDITYHITVSN
jgi:hypothetical protein